MKSARAAIVLAALFSVPALALAQQVASEPKVELGVDLALQFSKPSSGDGYFHLGAPLFHADYDMVMLPVMFRLGFLAQGPLSFETRLAAGVVSMTGTGGRTYYAITPGLNLVYRLSGKPANDNSYVTGGASFDVVGVSGGGTSSETYALVTLNAGIGIRRPWGTNASRGEFFVAYTLENSAAGMPSTFHVGVRLGMSLLK